MTSAATRYHARALPADDVIGLLLEQHAHLQRLCQRVACASRAESHDAVAELGRVLRRHETAEQLVVRPVAREAARVHLDDALPAASSDFAVVMARLAALDCGSRTFDREFVAFTRALTAHVRQEETEELPALLRGCSDAERADLGRRLLAARAA